MNATDIDQMTITLLARLGLSIIPHADISYGWGYTWHGGESGDWQGPYETLIAAAHAAFEDAKRAVKFRSDYSWTAFAQSGEVWRYDGEQSGDPDGWTHCRTRNALHGASGAEK